MDDKSEWMNTLEVARYLKVDRSTVYRMVDDGRLHPQEVPFYRRGKLFRRAEVEAIRSQPAVERMVKDQQYAPALKDIDPRLGAFLVTLVPEAELILRWKDSEGQLTEINLAPMIQGSVQSFVLSIFIARYFKDHPKDRLHLYEQLGDLAERIKDRSS